jgi:hypothetical protein
MQVIDWIVEQAKLLSLLPRALVHHDFVRQQISSQRKHEH